VRGIRGIRRQEEGQAGAVTMLTMGSDHNGGNMLTITGVGFTRESKSDLDGAVRSYALYCIIIHRGNRGGIISHDP
jgi:hypothetical protein